MLLLVLGSCVGVDPETGEVNPRGNQRFTFAEVKDNAADLRVGLTKIQVILLLGTPAEKDRSTNTWVYLPERPAVIVPGRALRLEFKNGRLADFGYHAIVLGQRL
ncbi:MAG: outer membrane protein assembly factor BamE (lipoprotein component of BamABCDE complex) [Planctomycetota bacterium]|jgi:outer membrane protein assembly factor BamE (lipoprotein component of BamABCDE complex)